MDDYLLIQTTVDQAIHPKTSANEILQTARSIAYEGKYKGFLRTPEEVIAARRGHCWEVSGYVLYRFRELGVPAWTVFFGTPDDRLTHTTSVYLDDGKFFWMEPLRRGPGIRGPFTTRAAALDCIRTVISTEEGTPPEWFTFGTDVPQPRETEASFFNKMTTSWKQIK